MKKKTITLENFITRRAGTKYLDYEGGKDDTNDKGIENTMKTSRGIQKKIKKNSTSVPSNSKIENYFTKKALTEDNPSVKVFNVIEYQ